MSKKIVILDGSPRPNGNTAALIRSFTDGATAAGHTVTRFDLQKMDIHLDLCQYFGQKKSKDYTTFFSSSSSFC
ncbi:NAD(P)H-dependent oxidoreductase [Hungatella hathewayi]|uniref:NAD(P)H-dependent oxidoreductase n=1 Tax=Hungatella hathewayi TaxID=154046 RepID=UPI0035688ABB